MSQTPKMIPPYASPKPRLRRRWVVVIIGAVIFVLFVAVSLSPFAVKSVKTEMDAVTGSTRRTTTWFNIIHTSSDIELSSIAIRARAEGITWAPEWRGYSFRAYGILWDRIGCGDLPEIAYLRPYSEIFTKSASTDELRKLIEIMQKGNETQQRDAVEATLEKCRRELETK